MQTNKKYNALYEINRRIKTELDADRVAALMEERRIMETDYILTEQMRITREIGNLSNELINLPNIINAARALQHNPPMAARVTIRETNEMKKSLTSTPQRAILYKTFENALTPQQVARVNKYFPRAKKIGYIVENNSGLRWTGQTTALFAWFIRETLSPNPISKEYIPYKAIQNLFGKKGLYNAVTRLDDVKDADKYPIGREFLKSKIFYDE